MVESTTKNYSWTKPEITKSPSTWGGFLNADLDSLDAIVFANQQGLAPIGSGALWFSATAPANWLICDGRALATTGTYAALFAVIGYTWGGSGANFNLPNLQEAFGLGAGATHALGATGGEATHVLTEAEMPSHTHLFASPAHHHQISDQTHFHGVTDPGHVHAMALPNQPGITSAGSGESVTVPGSTAWSTGGAATGISINGAATGITTTLDAVSSGTNNPTGGGAAHNNLPPFLALNFIIRYQ